jgi:hypothetical protein
MRYPRGDERDLLGSGLGNQQAIKWISMMRRQFRHGQRMQV